MKLSHLIISCASEVLASKTSAEVLIKKHENANMGLDGQGSVCVAPYCEHMHTDFLLIVFLASYLIHMLYRPAASE